MHKLFLVLLLFFIPASGLQHNDKQEFLSQEKLVICIHGTLLPHVIRPFVTFMSGPPGTLVPTKNCSLQYLNFSRALHESNPEEFPESSVYLYRWSGKLDFFERKKAAHDLFELLKNYSGRLEIIAHSHGCNVALNLAFLAKKNPSIPFKVDKLVLIAAPVQKATEHLIHSSIFKRVFSLYSTGDFIQIADPQGLYNETLSVPSKNKAIPFFSQRMFSHSSRLIQARLLINKTSPGHLDLISSPFIKHLFRITKLLEEHHTQTKKHMFTINISHNGPELINILTPHHLFRQRRNHIS